MIAVSPRWSGVCLFIAAGLMLMGAAIPASAQETYEECLRAGRCVPKVPVPSVIATEWDSNNFTYRSCYDRFGRNYPCTVFFGSTKTGSEEAFEAGALEDLQGWINQSACRCSDDSIPLAYIEEVTPWATDGEQRPRSCGTDGLILPAKYKAPWQEFETYNEKLIHWGAQCGESRGAYGWAAIIRGREAGCPAGTEPFRPSPYSLACRLVRNIASFAKTVGAPQSCPKDSVFVANPINIATGNKYQLETDYVGAGPFPLRFERHYNSDSRVAGSALGAQWRHNYSRELVDRGIGASLQRADGKLWYFHAPADHEWVAEPDVAGELETVLDGGGSAGGFLYRNADDTAEHYDAAGRLVKLVDRQGLEQKLHYDAEGRLEQIEGPFGRHLELSYADGRLKTLTDPAGGVVHYEYDAAGNLVSVRYPDTTPEVVEDDPTRVYHYEDARHPHALTGLTDERGVRFVTWTYDDAGRAISSERAGGVERADVVYQEGLTTVTDALGHARDYKFELSHGVPRLVEVSGGPCTSGCDGGGFSSQTYDANGFLESRTDFNGNRTTYVNDARGLELSRTEAEGRPEARTVTTEWHPTLRQPVKVTEPGRVTTFTYDAFGRAESRTVTDVARNRSRTVRHTYGAHGLLQSTDGPRTDIDDLTSYTYDGDGNVSTIANALGQVTRFALFDAHGRPLEIEDPNGVRTTLSYDARGRLLERSTLGRTTRFTYDPAGSMVRATLPDGSYTDLVYDAARRPVGFSDPFGNRVEHELDAAGSRTAERFYNPAGELTRRQTFEYSTLGRLETVLGGDGRRRTRLFYDAAGNLIRIRDRDGRLTRFGHDGRGRLTRQTDADDGVARFRYDDWDNVKRVIDARGLETRYVYDALDNLLRIISPDTGRTRYSYDDAGNRRSQTDARGVRVRFRYDALGRLLSIRYPDAAENVTLAYDTGDNGVGRLTTITDPSGTTRYTYDASGNLLTATLAFEGQELVTSYAYDLADRLVSVTRPSGTTVEYTRDASGRVVAVSARLPGLPAAPLPIVEAVEYAPFGPVTSLRYGSGLKEVRVLDLDYRVKALRNGKLRSLRYTYDRVGNLARIEDRLDPIRSQDFTYDGLDRLASANGLYGALSYSYDAVGNRTEKVSPAGIDVYANDPASNRVSNITGPGAMAFAYDPAGNTTTRGDQTLHYNGANRLSSIDSGGTQVARYAYDVAGARARKTTATEDVRFHYDLSGRLIAERDLVAGRESEYVYFNGIPIATLVTQGGTTSVYYAHTDHLGTPKLFSDQRRQLAWSGDSLPFGEVESAEGPLANPLRFPGQYFDEESGLHYNHHRYYEPATGRYVRADPLGVSRDGTNLYGYVRNRPTEAIDPRGLESLADFGGFAGLTPFDPRSHYYRLRTKICSCACDPDSQCRTDVVAELYKPLSAPFTTEYQGDGIYDLFGPWSPNPIDHFYENLEDGPILVNLTREGHVFHAPPPESPGMVTHRFYRENCAIWVDTEGAGTGPLPLWNETLGYLLFLRSHHNLLTRWRVRNPDPSFPGGSR